MAIAAYALAICIGVTSSPWPIGRLPIEEPEYSLEREHHARVPRRAVRRPVGAPKPKRRTQSLKRPAPSSIADLDRADVARAGEDLRGRERFFGVFGVVVDRAVGDLDLVGDVERRVRRDQALLQRARRPSTTLNVEPGS